MISVIILAAGKGKRMGGEGMPKILRPLRGKPILEYVISAIEESGVGKKPIAVVGYRSEIVKEHCGDSCVYAEQKELLGTGDAVRSAKEAVGNAEHVLVLNGDMPLVSGRTIRHIANVHLATGATMTMGTVRANGFSGWNKLFADFGRVIRDEQGNVDRIVEVKDANEKELFSDEVNPGIFCFSTKWLWSEMETLTTENAQGEYYLTDLLEKAVSGGQVIKTAEIPSKEAIGVNTPEQLAFAETLLK